MEDRACSPISSLIWHVRMHAHVPRLRDNMGWLFALVASKAAAAAKQTITLSGLSSNAFANQMLLGAAEQPARSKCDLIDRRGIQGSSAPRFRILMLHGSLVMTAGARL